MKEKNLNITINFFKYNYNISYTITYFVIYLFSRKQYYNKSYRKC